MKFNKLFGILLLISVLMLCIGAVAAADNNGNVSVVGTDNGNLMVENEAVSDTLHSSSGDVLSAGNSWYVKAGATGGDGSEASPFGDLKSALDNTNLQEGDTIYVMSGTYKGESNTGLTIDKNNLNIVSVDDKKPVFDGENSRQIFKITGDNVVLKGLQLTKGKSANGGALFIDGDNVKVDKCTISSNSNSGNSNGAAIYIADHKGISIVNSSINANKASNMGGAIYNLAHDTLIADCSFYNNKARNGATIFSNNKIRIVDSSIGSGHVTAVHGFGGGVLLYTDASESVIDNVKFSSCYGDQGGAIAAVNCDNITVNDCEIANSIGITDSYQAADSDGAAIWMNGKNNLFNNTSIHDCAGYCYGIVYVPSSSDNTTFNNCSFLRNAVNDYYGSGIYSNSNNLLVNNSYFFKNHCSKYGGAIFANTGDNITIVNSEFVGNYAERGGAVYFGKDGATRCTNPVIDNCTFTDNGIFPNPPFDRNLTKGGAIFSWAENTTITNSNFTHNVALMGGAILFEYGHNFLENNTFTKNIAEKYGGGAVSSTKQGDTINNCTFIDNHAQGYGGALSCDYPTVTNSTFIRNHGNHGGAICTIIANVSDCEFYDNTADDDWVVLAATKLNENNNIHPGQVALSMNHTNYIDMTYDREKNIGYADGYYVYCIEEDADYPRYGVLWENLRFAQNAITEEKVGELLKILILTNWNNENVDHNDLQDEVNIFTDHDYENSNNPVVKKVLELYNSGYRVPTNNAIKTLDDGRIEVFNFVEILTPSATQNVIGFNVTIPKMSVEKDVINVVCINKQAEFNITVKNTGECNITLPWINETYFSDGLVYDSFKSPYNWTYDKETKLWTLNDTLAPGKTANIILIFNVTKTGKMVNNVTTGLGNHTFDNDTVNFTSYAPNMTVEKISNNKTVKVGELTSFTIVVKNTGDCNLTGVYVIDKGADGLEYDHTVDETGKWSYDGNGRWNYNGTLGIGESANFTIVFKAMSEGFKVNNAIAGNNITNDTVNSTNTTNVTVEHNNETDVPENGTDVPDNTTVHPEKPVKSAKAKIDSKATGNPIMALIVVLIALGFGSRRRKQ